MEKRPQMNAIDKKKYNHSSKIVKEYNWSTEKLPAWLMQRFAITDLEQERKNMKMSFEK